MEVFVLMSEHLKPEDMHILILYIYTFYMMLDLFIFNLFDNYSITLQFRLVFKFLFESRSKY